MRHAIAGAAYAALVAPAALAQAPQDAVERCRAAATDAERIACLEAALLGDDAAAAPMPRAADQTAPSVESQEQTGAGAQGGMFARLPFIGRSREGGADAAAGEVQSSPAPAPSPAAGLGAEQVEARRAREAERENGTARAPELRLAARIVDFAHTAGGGLVVVLDNGQAWGQIPGDTSEIDLDEDETYTVEIERGAVSGYRLRINEIRRVIRVERLR